MTEQNNKDATVIIGLDGGASKVSGWQIDQKSEYDTFALGSVHAEVYYHTIKGHQPDFNPVPVKQQLQEREQSAIQLTDHEKQQATVYIEACAQVIAVIARTTQSQNTLIGLGMPGLKTDDKRGIAVVANGPRILDYCDRLEARLKELDIPISAPIRHIGSDADYCGIGENYADSGRFRDVDNAYYLGGGTGIADAMKLNGTLLPFDQIKDWIAKSWELKDEHGRSMENYAAAGGIQKLYAETAERPLSELNDQKIYPLQIASMAANGDSAARKTFERVVESLARLLYERITTLFAGWQGFFDFVNPNKPQPSMQHNYHGQRFERIILGQRLGEIFASDSGQSVLAKPLLRSLEQMIKTSGVLDNESKNHYNDLSGLIVASNLREAPALGAGIDAYLQND